MTEITLEYRKHVRTTWLWVGSFALLILVGEAGFNLVERALGRYLVWHNTGREKIGRSWQEDQNRLVANTNLEKITQVRREQLSLIAGISKFEDLVYFTAASARTELPPEHSTPIIPSCIKPLCRTIRSR